MTNECKLPLQCIILPDFGTVNDELRVRMGLLDVEQLLLGVGLVERRHKYVRGVLARVEPQAHLGEKHNDETMSNSFYKSKISCEKIITYRVVGNDTDGVVSLDDVCPVRN